MCWSWSGGKSQSILFRQTAVTMERAKVEEKGFKVLVVVSQLCNGQIEADYFIPKNPLHRHYVTVRCCSALFYNLQDKGNTSKGKMQHLETKLVF